MVIIVINLYLKKRNGKCFGTGLQQFWLSNNFHYSDDRVCIGERHTHGSNRLRFNPMQTK